jgi:hypothetical protein
MYKLEELLSLADEMAAGASSLALGTQNYQQFIDARERLVKCINNLKDCEHKKS